MKKNKFIIGLLLVVMINFVFASDENLSMQDQAITCINYSQGLILDLQSHNFSVVRVNDLLHEATDTYEAQAILESRQAGKGDFNIVLKKCNEIQSLYRLAFESMDSFISLQRFYEESLSGQPDTSSVDSLITEIQLEMQNERYERVPALVDNAYSTISALRAENTQLKLFYKSTTRGFANFVYDHRIEIVVIVSLIILLFLIYRVTIKKLILNKKITNLNLRKESLKNLIMKTQKSFFQDGQMSEADYNMRVKHFAEMVRDIDRQIPLLNEEYLKLSRKVDK